MFRGFDDDPFFKDFNDGFRARHGGDIFGSRDMFQDIDKMMSSMSRGMGGMLGEGGGEGGGQVAERGGDRATRSFFPNMDTLQRQMDEMTRGGGGGDGYSFSSQQVYSYRNTGKGDPEEYQAISSTARGPGGVKETKKGYKDSTTKTQKMQHGRHIGDRATLQERSQVRDKREEKVDYRGFAEDQAPEFNREWGSKAGGLYRPSFGEPSQNRGLEGRRQNKNKQRALPAPK